MTGPARPEGPGANPALRRLAGLRRRARLALLWEGLWPLAWPVLGVLGLFLVAALSGVFLILPPVVHAAILAFFVTGLGLALLRAWRGIAMPRDDAADRRLEQASGLPHRPLTTIADRPTGNDPASLALWKVHQDREAARIRALRVGTPRPRLPSRDPRALRHALVVALLAAFVAAGGEAPERLRRALWPDAAPVAGPVAPGARLEAWVTPPAYTGAAPIFLDSAGGSATVPAGSRLRIALSGGASDATPTLLRDGAEAGAFTTLGAGSHLAEATLDTGGRITVRQGPAEVATWSLVVQADAPPRISFAEPPAPAQRGLAIRLPWRAEDDWGVAAARAEIRLEARPDAAPITLDLSVPPGHPKAPRGVAAPDLSAHPWAGLPVRARLIARDGAAQEGASDDAPLTLPERSFNHPVAQALIAIRKGLSVAPHDRERAAAGLEAIAEHPETFEGDSGTLLALRSSRSRLKDDARAEAVPEVQQTLWELALALEEGRTDRTSRALVDARQRLREALRERSESMARDREERDRASREAAEEARREQEAREGRDRETPEQRAQREAREANETPEQRAEREQREQAESQQRDQAARERAEQREQAARERAEQREQAQREQGEQRSRERTAADRRIQELRDAIRRHLDALAEQLQRENNEVMPDPQTGQQQRREADRRTRRMQEQNRADRPEDAERELAELERMLDQLENGELAQSNQEQRRQRRERGQQQMGVVGDMVRRQSRLLDGAHQRDTAEEARRNRERRPFTPFAQRPPFQQPDPGASTREREEAQAEANRDARTQRALRRALGELMQQQGDLTGEVPAPLGRADQAMRESAEALTEGRDARPHQQQAIRELSEGGRQMAQRMARQFGPPQEGEGEEEGEGQGDAMAEGSMQGGEGQDRMAELGEGRDPLGRRLREANGSNEEGGDTRVPDEAEQLRTRRLQDELRRRSAERERPAGELDYIERLLPRY
ncbi:DUF4175 family protein [Roseomonas sp. CCTCC AB2023176]|uniref:DUF4175 family protein n=1 Tax=Roseomonas sp. CCTCC AB2023176 TaxID=3342640 RepID=UPI0035D5E301